MLSLNLETNRAEKSESSTPRHNNMPKPSIKTITVRNLTNILLITSLIALIAIGFGFRMISYKIIENKTFAIAEVIIAGLTSHMKADIMDKRDYFLEEIRSLYQVQEVSLIRSPDVTGQFGSGFDLEQEGGPVAKEVFETGQPVFILDEFSRTPHIRVLIPYIATREGNLNCLSCHAVDEGTVLGAVGIKLDLTDYRSLVMKVLTAITLLALVMIVLICVNIFRTIQRHIKDPLEKLMTKARKAYLDQEPLNPEQFDSMEFEDIAEKFNMFNTEVLANQNLINEKNYELLALNDEIEDTLKETVFTMGVVEEQRSRETGDHTKRVTRYSNLLATKLGLPQRDIDLVTAAAPLHDIGKLGIADSILLKPGKLTDEEFEIIKNHAGVGYAMLVHSRREILKSAAIIAHQHHEKWDGTGYPQGLKGEAIHIYARIVALADVFDSLSSDRVYRPAWDKQRVLDWIESQRGKHFEPRLVDLFMENLPAFREIQETHLGVVNDGHDYVELHPETAESR